MSYKRKKRMVSRAGRFNEKAFLGALPKKALQHGEPRRTRTCHNHIKSVVLYLMS